MAPELSAVIVNYNSGTMVTECVRSLVADRSLRGLEIVVVDNASSDGSADRLVREFPAIRLIRSHENVGFGAANNVAIAECSAPWILMLNPDTLLFQGGLSQFVAFMEAHPRAGLAGPRVLNPDGSLALSIGNFPTILREAFECLFLHRLFPRLTLHWADIVQEPGAYGNAHTVQWVGGAVMLARAEALRQVGGFDQGFFLYSEEIDLCRRLNEAGWKVWYDPSVRFLHIGGEFDIDPGLAVENQRSKLRFFRKHYGSGRMLAFATVIVVRLAMRCALWALSGLLRHDERERKRARAGLAVLRSYPALVLHAVAGARPVTIASGRRETA